MRKFLSVTLAAFLLTLVLPAAARAEDGKQSIFLMCPHQKKYSAWNVYLTVDPSSPDKVTGLGLEKLDGVNSVDAGGVEAVQTAQNAAGTKRENLGKLSVAEFGKGQIKIEKDDALHLGMETVDASTYRLVISMRCTSDMRFNVGGKEAKRRDLLVKYDKDSKTWKTTVAKMNSLGDKPILEPGANLVGIVFPVTGTGIYRIVGILAGGDSAVLIDGWRRED